MNCDKHTHDNDDDFYDMCEDPCARPVDPCAARWRREKAYSRREKRETGTIILIAVLVAAAAVGTFALFATGVLVWNSVDDNRVVGVPATGDCNTCDEGGGDKDTSSVVINTDKIVIDKDKHQKDKKYKHD